VRACVVRPSRLLHAAPVLALAAVLVLSAWTALAGTAVLTKSGTLYEVYPATYGQVAGDAAGGDASLPVLALRTTPSGGTPTVQIVDGTLDSDVEASASIEFEEETQTVFLVYTKEQSLFKGVIVALLRDGIWSGQLLPATAGFTLGMNPQMVLTRQQYADISPTDPTQTIEKWRSIVSVTWWEEGSLSQAKFSPLFVEDGALVTDAIASYNLNDLAGASGPTSEAGLSPPSYSFPAVQRGYSGDGSVLVSFANLSTLKQTVLSISFPVTVDAGPGVGGTVAYSRHRPIISMVRGGDLPGGIMAYATSPGTIISPDGTCIFWWIDGSTMKYLPENAAADAAAFQIPLRPDFPVEKALAAVRDLAAKE
jgi:hypothetical protein